MFTLIKGKTKNHYFNVTPSTVFAERSLVIMTGGKLVPAVAGSAKGAVVGVLVGAIAATDADYADERKVAVEVPTQINTVYEFPTVAAVATDVGVDVDLIDSESVDRSAVLVGCVRMVTVITATKCRGLININENF